MRRLLFSAVLLLAATACDTGPSGPGEFQASLRSIGEEPGAAVLLVTGPGIEAFSGSDGTRVFWARASRPNTYRVILVKETAGNLDFRVQVQDLGARMPTATVLNVVGGENLPLAVTGDFKVRFRR